MSKAEVERTARLVCRVLERLTIRTSGGRPVEWHQDDASHIVVMNQRSRVGYIAKWEIEAVVKELLEECGK